MTSGLTSFDLNQPDLPTLLRRVEAGEIQLPDFQRGWVWKEEGIAALIASVTLAYPVGAILMLKTGGQRSFHPRPIEGAPKVARAPELLILDGQQRITSLYQALRMDQPVLTRDAKGNKVQRVFYLDIRKCLDPNTDRIDAILAVPEDRVVRTNFHRDVELDLSTRALEYEHWMMPTRVAFDAQRANEWQMGFIQHHSATMQETFARYAQFQQQVLSALQNYRVPSIELGASTPHVAVCQVFENVNTGGVKLTIFELLTATFSADDSDFRLRADWFGEEDEQGATRGGRQRALHEHAVLRGIRGRDFIQACTLLATYEAHLHDPARPVGCRRKEMLDLTLEQYRSVADRVQDGFLRAARFLGRLRIFQERNVPYQSQLVPLAAILARLGGREESEAVRQKLERWYWCGVFGELYGSSTETRFALDIAQVLAWIDGASDEPRTVTDGRFTPTRLLSLRTRLSAAYKGIAALLLVGGCRDVARGDVMGDVLFDREGIDIHHLFPVAWCKAKGISSKDYNSVVNRTPLARRTNQRLGGTAPSSYLARLESDDVTEAALDEYLRSHLANPDLLRLDDYQGFKIDRARRILDRIEEATGRAIDGRDSEAVEKAFGSTLPPLPREQQGPSRTLYGRYVVLRELHGGGMSRAYVVRDKQTEQRVFLKEARVDGSIADAAMHREIDTYQRLERANVEGILQVLDVHRGDDTLCIVTELATGGTLEDRVAEEGHLAPPEVKAIGLSLASCLSALHEMGVVHRDLKPANVLRVDDEWKLGDFGIAKSVRRLVSQRTLRHSGSPGYAPDEQLVGADPHPSMDVYALGKLLTYLLTGQTDTDQVQRAAWRDLVRHCSHPDPEERPSASDVQRMLEALPC